MIVCQMAVGAFIGALISAIWDDDDEGLSQNSAARPPGLTEDEYYGWLNMLKLDIIETVMSANNNIPFQTAVRIAEEVHKKHGNNRDMMEQEAYKIARAIDETGAYYSSPAEKQYVQSNYFRDNYIDDQVEQKPVRIHRSIDPADDGDLEQGDFFSFETEIENMFGVEQMAISEEDIQSESDVRDPSSVDPIDEITQDEEVEVGDTTTGVESETDVTEEIFFQEAVIYPDIGDLDLDPTNDNEDLYVPEDEYRPQEEIEARIEFMEEVLDDAIESLNANVFESMAGTFYQDDSEPVELMDDPYFADGIDNSLVIDFSSITDDVGDVTDLIDDTFGISFFEWMESPANESLDINPAPGFSSPYGILGGI